MFKPEASESPRLAYVVFCNIVQAIHLNIAASDGKSASGAPLLQV